VTHASLLVLMAPREGGNATLVFGIQMVAIFAIFYFLLIRPQRKEQDKHRQMLEALKKGDEVITAGGIIGQVIHADQDRVTIRTAETTRLVIERARISKVVSGKTEGP
jgi:preprotein translocase subunit YajC